MAFDTSGIASTSGRIYVSRGNSLGRVQPRRCRSPNIENVQATVGHDDATGLGDDRPRPRTESVRLPDRVGRRTARTADLLLPVRSRANRRLPTKTNRRRSRTHLDRARRPRSSYRARVVVKTNNGVNRSAPVKIRPGGRPRRRDRAGDERHAARRRVLNGSLDPDGMPTTYWFEYGIDTNYRQRTAEVSAGPESGSVAVAPTEIDNLQPGRRYHFRLVAHNDSRDDQRPRPDLRRGFARRRSPASARPTSPKPARRCNARIDPGGFPTTYRFEYGTDRPTTARSCPRRRRQRRRR